jgi:FkbM family methyltransferase
MSLERFIPSKLKSILIAIQVNTVTRTFLASRKLFPKLNLYLLARGGNEILQGTALFPEKGFHVVDIGAFRGWYTLISALIAGSNGFVYSFEPEPGNFEVLHKVVSVCGLKNIKISRLAINDKSGFEFLYLSEHPSMHSLIQKKHCMKIAVPCMKLDDIVKLEKIKKLDLIKVDVEGAELKVLRGGENTIRSYEPIFSIDVNHYDGEFEEVSAFIREFNYEIYPLVGKDTPYSIVAYPPHKKGIVKRLIYKTRVLSSTFKLS